MASQKLGVNWTHSQKKGKKLKDFQLVTAGIRSVADDKKNIVNVKICGKDIINVKSNRCGGHPVI